MFHKRDKTRWSLLLTFVSIAILSPTYAEDGYNLWLRYHTMDDLLITQYRNHVRSIVSNSSFSPIMQAAVSELQRGITGMLNVNVTTEEPALSAGAIVVGTPVNSDAIRQLNLAMDHLGNEGYLIRQISVADVTFIVVAGNTERGALYGSFEFLKQIQMHNSLDGIDITSVPKIQLRLLNHWDNLDGTVERGYAGSSVWDWWKLPDIVDPRYTDYSRAVASIGINGVVVNNVNAKPDILTALWISKVTALANVFRPYGIQLFLSVRFSTPLELGETNTADPLNQNVVAWWNAKVEEVYTAIPDFGGFLVKASSEGQPGPDDYGRSHSEGANMLASAVQRFGGVIMWRAFVYSQDDPDDRAKQAYTEFKSLDGQFNSNVILQVKNGAIDFQPREPFHPLFGALPETQTSVEFQITKEYLGFASHIAYLGPMWEEVLDADTFAKGSGSTVSRVTDGTLFQHSLSSMAGVANIGNNRDWTGSHFNQANWYAYGKLAWDPDASSRSIAEEWLRLTFTTNAIFVERAADIMMMSREAVANYMTPLGLHHLMATGHHYGPGPWVDNLSRPEWNPAYYHNADENGIGFNRTDSGSGAILQYAPEVMNEFANSHTMDERYLLWFHHLSWDYQLKSGRTLWDSIVLTYDEGVASAVEMSLIWDSLRSYIDAERFENVAINLRIQLREAKWWRDACVAYFQSISNRALPSGTFAPEKTLAEYKALQFPFAPGTNTISIEVTCLPSGSAMMAPFLLLTFVCLLALRFV
ncbi:extracellular xylan exo-alpha-(1-_2)-glucuronosidase-like [Bradysia coprophila]|uniref:extracellular xylan exo-alpha-(1->2)-glucuronosidase-like n=1 Tax=Bradysia coprophila TaxID=38358 RepID=UPI00187D78A1|nr:extracellular xylan exo-alpha-(1->2)-glucuronosidase-like [Bradysia coprophila]